ncbi:hypothetical protein QQS21_000541 [Conoideocrella luteorostrata]|uniref:Heat-labile enterotoxin, A chain n=1 Tax=Conoideocrella luteorostrata TaxID=1105319 RepID=A0AAJ0D1M3_9HYPO|nr:hypothetical protein QQS21_000541 [Conoideocrella luteorostrata]
MLFFQPGLTRNSLWLSLVLYTTLFVLFGFSDGHPFSSQSWLQVIRRGGCTSKQDPQCNPPSKYPSDKAPAKTYPKFEPKVNKEDIWVVFRGDSRNPTDIEKARGFSPQGTPSDDQIEGASSLFKHVTDKEVRQYRQYVSTTMDPVQAVEFGQSTGYIYVISPDAKMVDVRETLRPHLEEKFMKEMEQAAVARIPFEQIRGWYKTSDLRGKKSKLMEIRRAIETGTATFPDPFIKNKKYDIKYDTTRPSGARPEIAGFPPKHQAWKQKPWSDYKPDGKKKKVSSYLKDLIQEVAPGQSKLPTPPEVPGGLGGNKKPPGGTGDAGKGTGNGKVESASGSICKRDTSCSKLVETAEQISEKKFLQLADEHGVAKIAEERWSMSLPDVRKELKYQRLSLGSIKSMLSKAGKEVLGDPLWILGVVDAFTSDVTKLDRFAALTAIIPVVGCGAQAAADEEKGNVDPMDTFLCVFGDVLLLTPAWPVGVAINIVRAVRGFFRPPKVPTKEDMQTSRDRAWNRFLDDRIYTYIYSHPYNSKKGSFSDKLNSSLAIEALAVLSQGAQTVGAAQAAVQDASGNGNSTMVATRLQEAMSNEIVRRQRQVLINLPKALKKDTEGSLGPLAADYNKGFVGNLTTQDMVNRYKETFVGDPEVPGSARTNEDEVRAKLKDIATYLEKTPPKLPGLFDLAYIIGQSRGMVSLDPKTLSPADHVNATAPGQSELYVNALSLHHAVQVARLLRGSITEDKLSTEFPTKDGARDLQILIAMKFGRVYDEAKFKMADEMFKGSAAYFIDLQDPNAIRVLTHPDIPAVKANTEAVPYLALVTGLTDNLIENLRRLKDTKTVGMTQVIMDMLKKIEGQAQQPGFQWDKAIRKAKEINAADRAAHDKIPSAF